MIFGAFVEVIFAPTAGFGLLDFLKDREAVLIVDAIITGKLSRAQCTSFQQVY